MQACANSQRVSEDVGAGVVAACEQVHVSQHRLKLRRWESERQMECSLVSSVVVCKSIEEQM